MLFSDAIMPGDLNGDELALAARTGHPALKVLLASGFAGKPEEYANGGDSYLSSLAGNLLSKPYNDEDLAFAVRRTMDGGPG